jgi:undecaprenyl-diphosphatase
MDAQLFLFLNGLHADWLDPVMVAITEMWPWIPLYLLLLFLVFKQFGKRGWWILLGVCVVILCSDQLSAHVCKPLFQRLRPCFNPELEGLVHLPNGLPGGRFGFVSSHAANTFAVASYLTGVLWRRYRWIGWVLYGWAFLSSYSRIYVGVHYPGDIVAGAALGILIGLLGAMVLRKLSICKSNEIKNGRNRCHA